MNLALYDASILERATTSFQPGGVLLTAPEAANDHTLTAYIEKTRQAMEQRRIAIPTANDVRTGIELHYNALFVSLAAPIINFFKQQDAYRLDHYFNDIRDDTTNMSFQNKYLFTLFDDYSVRPSLVTGVQMATTQHAYAWPHSDGIPRCSVKTVEIARRACVYTPKDVVISAGSMPALVTGAVTGHAHPVFFLTSEDRSVRCTTELPAQQRLDMPSVTYAGIATDRGYLFSRAAAKDMYAFIDHAKNTQKHVLVGGQIVDDRFVVDLIKDDEHIFVTVLESLNK